MYEYLKFPNKGVSIDYNSVSKGYVEDLLSKIKNSIETGVFPITPSDDACKYCKYAGFCGKGKVEGNSNE